MAGKNSFPIFLKLTHYHISQHANGSSAPPEEGLCSDGRSFFEERTGRFLDCGRPKQESRWRSWLGNQHSFSDQFVGGERFWHSAWWHSDWFFFVAWLLTTNSRYDNWKISSRIANNTLQRALITRSGWVALCCWWGVSEYRSNSLPPDETNGSFCETKKKWVIP